MSHINGYRVTSSVESGRHVYRVPALGVAVSLDGPVPAGVIASLGPSPQGTVMAPGPIEAVPSGWHLVSYRGVRIDVPASWPVVDGNHAGACGSPFSHPTVYVGETHFVPSCPAPDLESVGPRVNGLWLVPGGRSTPAGATVKIPSGQALKLRGTSQFNDAVVQVWYHGVSLSLGVGRSGATARAVLDSIRYKAGAPDTPVGSACPAGQTTMPTPERLATRQRFEGGTYTLLPPARSDKPTMSAARVWKDHGPPQPGERDRLVLARFSARLPARRNADGTFTPIDRNILAWVVITTPTATPAGPCGGHGLLVYNARSGQAVISAGSGP